MFNYDPAFYAIWDIRLSGLFFWFKSGQSTGNIYAGSGDFSY